MSDNKIFTLWNSNIPETPGNWLAKRFLMGKERMEIAYTVMEFHFDENGTWIVDKTKIEVVSLVPTEDEGE